MIDLRDMHQGNQNSASILSKLVYIFSVIGFPHYFCGIMRKQLTDISNYMFNTPRNNRHTLLYNIRVYQISSGVEFQM